MKTLLSFLLILLIGACQHQAIEVTRSDNPDINVHKLLTIEGCNVYRFYDARAVYVTICPSTQPVKTDYNYTVSTGKSSSIHYLESLTVRK